MHTSGAEVPPGQKKSGGHTEQLCAAPKSPGMHVQSLSLELAMGAVELAGHGTIVLLSGQ